MSENEKGDPFTIDRCDVGKTGQCAMHGVEIERRKSTQKEIAFLKEALKESENHITSLLVVKNRLIGVSLLGLTIILGGYIYTHDHITASRISYADLKTEVRVLQEEDHITDREVSAIREKLVREEERALGISSRLSSIDAGLRQLIGLQMREGKITTEELMKFHESDKVYP